MVKETKELKLFYWSNAAGDLYDPHKEGYHREISESKLPEELKNAWDHLWSKDTGSYCYLVEIEGAAYPYSIALCNEYGKEDYFSHEDVIKRGDEVIRLMKAEGIDGEVYAGLSDEKYRSDDYLDELMVIMPAGISKEKFNRVADFLYNAAYKKDVTYDAYKELKNHQQEIDQMTEEKSDLDVIREAYVASDKEESASYLAEVLMDDQISTYGIFEDLASVYINGSEEFRKGLDTAVRYITGRSIRDMSETVIEMAKEPEIER